MEQWHRLQLPFPLTQGRSRRHARDSLQRAIRAVTEPVHIEEAPQPPLLVSYQNGMLGIHSDKATLSEVLYLVQKRTGADIAIPAGAEQEKVAVDLGPAPAPEVLAQLLNGSKFNFLILNNANDPAKLDRVILSTRTEGNFVAPLPQVAEQRRQRQRR